MLNPKWCSYCDNETVDGVEYPGFPSSLEPQAGEYERLIVADMSSNFLSRSFDISKYAVVFGGAQKNIGTSSRSYLSFLGYPMFPETCLGSSQVWDTLLSGQY